MKGTSAKKLEAQRSLCFKYYENLQAILKDLEAIDKLTPRETSRYASASLERESDAIIQGRKHDLLRYIQTICRDHMYWSEELMKHGRKDCPWEPSSNPPKRKGPRTVAHDRSNQIGWKD
jgi:hypothetical protein